MTARAALAALALAAPALAGCYSVGFRPAGGAESVAVATFENATLRRHVEYDLTRHVRREVLEATPLHLEDVDPDDPEQLVLRGRVASIDEAVLIAGAAEEVLLASVTVSVSFGVYAGGALRIGEDTDGDGALDGELVLTTFAERDRTRGESRETAIDEALRDLAEMIVFRLAAREDDRFEPNDEPAAARALPLGRQADLRQREADWFRLTVPPRQRLVATIFFDEGGLTLSATDVDGAPLADATADDEGRIVRVPSAAEPRAVRLRVAGDDSGQRYALDLRLEPLPPE